MNVLLDTNILLRSSTPSDKTHQAAVNAIAALKSRGDVPCLVPQNVYEFWVVSSRPLTNNGRGLSAAEVASEVAVLESRFSVLPETSRFYEEWKRLVAAHGVIGKPAHDARLVAAMLAHGVTHLLTFNAPDFARYPGIVVLDPVALAAPSTP